MMIGALLMHRMWRSADLDGVALNPKKPVILLFGNLSSDIGRFHKLRTTDEEYENEKEMKNDF